MGKGGRGGEGRKGGTGRCVMSREGTRIALEEEGAINRCLRMLVHQR